MIPAAGIEDQELPVRAERPGIDHPAVARRGDLGAGPGGDRLCPFRCRRGRPRPPNSRIRTPLTGSGRCPRRRGKSNSRREPAGVLERRQIDPVVLGLVLGRPRSAVAGRACRRCRGPARALPIKSLRLSTWRASASACCRSASSAFSVSACCFCRSSISRRHALPLLVERGDVARRASRSFLGDVPADAQQVGQVGGERLGLHPHVGQHRAEHDGGAHRLQRVLGPDHHRRRRTAADPLQRGQHFGDHGAPALERARAAQRSLSSSGLRRASVVGDAALPRRAARAAVSISAWLSLRRSSPSASISARSLASISAALLLLGADRFELLVALARARRAADLRPAGAERAAPAAAQRRERSASAARRESTADRADHALTT